MFLFSALITKANITNSCCFIHLNIINAPEYIITLLFTIGFVQTQVGYDDDSVLYRARRLLRCTAESGLLYMSTLAAWLPWQNVRIKSYDKIAKALVFITVPLRASITGRGGAGSHFDANRTGCTFTFGMDFVRLKIRMNRTCTWTFL